MRQEILKLFLFIFSKIVTVLFMSNVMSVPNGSSLNLTVLKHFETTLEIQTALECLKVAAQLKIRLIVIIIQKLLSGFSV